MNATIPFEGNWIYQSFVVLPTTSELAAMPGSPITAKKWALGKLKLADGDSTEAAGKLEFAPGIELAVHITFAPGVDGEPALFEATGKGESGKTTGAVYHLKGWVFSSPSGKISKVCGSVKSSAEPELGGMPVGTVGTFVIVPAT